MTASLEEYIKTIYILINKMSVARVTDIASELGCTKPSVNRALKVLKEEGYIEYEAYKDIKLTKKGCGWSCKDCKVSNSYRIVFNRYTKSRWGKS